MDAARCNSLALDPTFVRYTALLTHDERERLVEHLLEFTGTVEYPMDLTPILYGGDEERMKQGRPSLRLMSPLSIEEFNRKAGELTCQQR
jgi:hypothetical protein